MYILRSSWSSPDHRLIILPFFDVLYVIISNVFYYNLKILSSKYRITKKRCFTLIMFTNSSSTTMESRDCALEFFRKSYKADRSWANIRI